MKSKLTGVPETMLIPLWARAFETRREKPIVKDEKALEIVSRIEYDFGKFEKAWMSQTGVAVRTMLLDEATRRFMEKNPDPVVINLGAGLDTRFLRVDNGRIRWYDLDLPEVIAIRKRFFDDSGRCRMIPRSVFDYAWIDEIAVSGSPVLIIAEGLLMYFDEGEVKSLLGKLTESFPGAEMLFEMLSPVFVGKGKHHDAVSKTKAEFKWGIFPGSKMESYNEKIEFVAEWNYFDYGKGRWRWMGWLAKVPAFRDRFNNRIVHLRFRDKT